MNDILWSVVQTTLSPNDDNGAWERVSCLEGSSSIPPLETHYKQIGGGIIIIIIIIPAL